MEKVIFSQEELEKLCKEWQTILGLNDWDIKTLICRKEDMFEKDTQGGCKCKLLKKTALIKILDNVDWGTDTLWEQDMELTLVHELIHVILWPLEYEEEFKGLQYVAMEQATEAIAKALIEVKRFKGGDAESILPENSAPQ